MIPHGTWLAIQQDNDRVGVVDDVLDGRAAIVGSGSKERTMVSHCGKNGQRGRIGGGVSDKLALLAGAAGAAVLGGEASAGIVAANGSFPLRGPSTPGNTPWDVDGDGTNDFQFTHLAAPPRPYGLFSALNGGRQVFGTYTSYPNVLKKLYTNGGTTIVGPAAQLSALVGNNVSSGQPLARITANGAITANVNYGGGWNSGDTGFFGFSFTSGSDTFYGWGEMSIDPFSNPATNPGYGFEITRAYYNDSPGTSIPVGVVPEPASVALLALGAGGLAAWRKRRKAAEAA